MAVADRRLPPTLSLGANRRPLVVPPHGAPGPAGPSRCYLRAGGLVISWKPCEVTTVLGSCVAVTFYCPKLGLGGICHALLPCLRHGDTCDTLPRPLRWRYVEFAVAELIACFCPPGVARDDVSVKLFGGSHLLARPRGGSANQGVGPSNVVCARALLADAGLGIVAEDVGGDRGRKLIFNTATGEVRIKRLGRESRSSPPIACPARSAS